MVKKSAYRKHNTSLCIDFYETADSLPI